MSQADNLIKTYNASNNLFKWLIHPNAHSAWCIFSENIYVRVKMQHLHVLRCSETLFILVVSRFLCNIDKLYGHIYFVLCIDSIIFSPECQYPEIKPWSPVLYDMVEQQHCHHCTRICQLTYLFLISYIMWCWNDCAALKILLHDTFCLLVLHLSFKLSLSSV